MQDLSFSAWVSTVLGVDAGGEMLLKVLYQGDHKDSKKMHWSRRVRLAHAQLSYAHAQAVLKGNQNNCDPGGGVRVKPAEKYSTQARKLQGSHHTWKTWKNRSIPGKPGKTEGFGAKTWKNIPKPGKIF